MFFRSLPLFRPASPSSPSASPRGRGGSWRLILAALVLSLGAGLMAATSADARIGGGGSFGSRGSRTFSMPSATPTAPRISPFQRSDTPRSNMPGTGFGTSGFNRSPGFFGGGFGRGLIGGFLGAGLFGLLFGNGFMGGLGGGMSLIGLILQLGLLYLLFRLVMGWFANRRPSYGTAFSANGSYGAGGASPAYGAAASVRSAPITIGPSDYAAFEARLVESQAAYSSGDVAALSRVSTPEMVRNFEAELRANAQRGVVNRLSDVRLIQGDLSEAWSESGVDYATVAMRFSLIDTTVETGSGRVVAGDPTAAQQVTEVWTFRRPAGAGAQAWALSGIQQA